MRISKLFFPARSEVAVASATVRVDWCTASSDDWEDVRPIGGHRDYGSSVGRAAAHHGAAGGTPTLIWDGQRPTTGPADGGAAGGPSRVTERTSG